MKKVLWIIMGVIIVFICGNAVYAHTRNYKNRNGAIVNNVYGENLTNCDVYYKEHYYENTYYNCGVFGCSNREFHTHDMNRRDNYHHCHSNHN